MTSCFQQRGLLSVDDLTREQIIALLDRAEQLRTTRPYPRSLAGKLVGLFFFQPSTRTRVGFHAAVARLGGDVVEITSPKYQPGMDRPESIEDTVRSVSSYFDILVVRHPSAMAAQEVFKATSAPVINAGTGHESHPTQALIDLFAIRRGLGTLDGLRIGLAGDLLNSRSAKSLLGALRCFRPAELRLMAPPGRGLSEASLDILEGVRIHSCNQLTATGLDVLYMAGCPTGAGADALPSAARAPLELTPGLLDGMRENGIVLCPFPRVDEISRSVDESPQAQYFRQSADGLSVRMAVLDQVLAEMPARRLGGRHNV